jgi:uncharacterized protein (DUF58 family)
VTSAAERPARWSRAWWASVTPVPTPRAAGVLLAVAVVSALVPVDLGVALPAAVVALLVVLDAALAPAPWQVPVGRELPGALPLDGDGEVVWRVGNPTGRALRVAIADELPPSLGADTRRVQATVPAHGRVRLRASLGPARRGTFRPSTVTVRVAGPLGLALRQADRPLPGRIEVHPRFRSRAAAELRIRRARVLEEGTRSVRGRGGGTEFEALREYVQGDEFRHVDWAATARAGEPIVRTFRAERNQTVLVLLDTGRVVAGLVEGVPRLDHAMDATLALATMATHLGDRIGLVAFGAEPRVTVGPRRDAGQLRRLSVAMHALEPELAESGYREAFRATLATFRRRALVVLLTELSAEAVQQTLVPALPLLTRDHEVIVASVTDPAVLRLRDTVPQTPVDAYGAVAAVSVTSARERAAVRLRAAGAVVVDAPPSDLAARLCDLYLDVKARGAL